MDGQLVQYHTSEERSYEYLDGGADWCQKSEQEKHQPRTSRTSLPLALAHPSSADDDRLGIYYSVGIFIEEITGQELITKKRCVLQNLKKSWGFSE